MQIALTIAGSDSGGGAGIQADLKTFQRFGVFGTSVITAVTAQNTLGVRAVHPVPPEMVRQQLFAVAEDLRPAAVKTGMLAEPALVREVAAGIRGLELPNYVLDPVMVASSGDRLLEPAAERDILEELVPLALLVTPNLAEAAVFTGTPVETPDAMELAGQRLLAGGAKAALIKGGHLEGDEAVDVLGLKGGAMVLFSSERVPRRRDVHGTGCALSAGITALLALGRTLEDAVQGGKAFVTAGIEKARPIGRGGLQLDFLAKLE